MKQLSAATMLLFTACFSAEELETSEEQLRPSTQLEKATEKTDSNPFELPSSGRPDPSTNSPGDERTDDPSNCIHWGRITYRNTVEDILQRHCTNCHAPELTDLSTQDAFAVAPKEPYLDTYTAAKTYGAEIKGAISGDQPKMPPPQSEVSMSDIDAFRLDKWLEVTAETDPHYRVLGSRSPSISITNANALRDFVRIGYDAADIDNFLAKVALFYDTDKSGFDGTLIKGCLSLGKKVVTWVPSGVPNGRYYVYGCVFDRDNVTCNYYDKAVKTSPRRPGPSRTRTPTSFRNTGD